MSKHTHGRLKVQHPFDGPRGWEVAFDPGLEQVCKNVTKKNARRLVACWNACEGVSTELLEKAPLDTVLKETVAQRDELLDALLKVAKTLDEHERGVSGDQFTYEYKEWASAVRAAIAKAEGGV